MHRLGRALGVAVSLGAWGCSEKHDAAPGNPADSTTPLVLDTHAVIPLGTEVDARAAKEILAHVPSASAPSGETRVGSDTGEDVPDGGTTTIHERPGHDHGAARVSGMSHVARAKGSIERLLRATVYFDLVDRCRADDGSILPPGSVKLHFLIAEDGRVPPTSVDAVATDARYEQAARCMVRELVASRFQAPIDTRGETTTVDTDVPSVD